MSEAVNSSSEASSNNGEHPPIQKHILSVYMKDRFLSHTIFYDWLWKQPDPLGEDTRRTYEVGTLALSLLLDAGEKTGLIKGICYPDSVDEKTREKLVVPFTEAAWEYINSYPAPSSGVNLVYADVRRWCQIHETRMRRIPRIYSSSRNGLRGQILFALERHYRADPSTGTRTFESAREILGTGEMRDSLHALCDLFSTFADPTMKEGVNYPYMEKVPDHLSQYLELRRFTEEELELLAPLASSILNEDGVEREEARPLLLPMARNMAHLTWEKLFTFAELVRDYNVEWALAAMEWGEDVAGEVERND